MKNLLKFIALNLWSLLIPLNSIAQDYETVSSIEFSTAPSKSVYVNNFARVVPGPAGVVISSYGKSFFIKINPGRAGENASGANYVRSESYRAAVTDENVARTLPVEKRSRTYTYLDGLGTHIQTVAAESSPGKRDLVSFKILDKYGREPKTFLPYTVAGNGTFRKAPEAEQLGFYAASPKVIKDIEPFNVNTFESSPMNRVRSSYSPGWNWHNDTESIPVSSTFLSNVANEVYLIKLAVLYDVIDFSASRYYPPNSLVVSRSISESGLITKTYRDINDQVVCEKKGNGSVWHETYYVYDQAGQLRFVIPPEASARFSQYLLAKDRQAFLNKWCFQYRYDTFGRTIEKSTPGSGWVSMIYDRWDRLVLTQDAKQRLSNKWKFTKYDVHNRPVMTGITTGLRTDLQGAINNATSRFESRAANAVGYTNYTFPVHSESNLLTIVYYDCYNFLNYPGWDKNGQSFLPVQDGFVDLTGIFAKGDPAKVYDPVVKGQVTGSKTKVLNSSDWLNSVTYYDKRYNVVQTISTNQFKKPQRISMTVDEFTGNVLKQKRTHDGPDGTLTIVEYFSYDHADRLLSVHHEINGQPKVLVSSFGYNELGQMIEKNVHSVNGSPFLQSIDYTYNIQGWLTHVNQVSATGGGNNDDSGDLFAMEVLFESPVKLYNNSFTSRKLFDGRVSATKWKIHTPVKAEERIYAFDYDNFGRFKKSYYATWNSGGWSGNAGSYDESVKYYDRNGNIGGGTSVGLVRNGMINGLRTEIDNLSYRYDGNVLKNVKDNTTHLAGFSDKPGVALSVNEFNYDPNGNLIEDQNKSITAISYNDMNLPEEITITRADLSPVRTDRIKFVYDASGNKLSREVLIGNVPVWKTNYAGGIQYDNGRISFVSTSEGRAVKNGPVYEYEYFFRDYQGNVRTVFGSFRETASYRATMEPARDNQERITFGFENITKTRVPGNNISEPADDVFTPSYSARCNAYRDTQVQLSPIGPAKSLEVKAGDAIYAEVYARYNNVRTTTSTIAIATLLSAVTSTFDITSAENPKLFQSVNATFPDVSSDIEVSGNFPKGYLMVLYFDKNYVLRKARAEVISERAYKQFEKLSVSLAPDVDGYVYIFVGNESNESAALDVYFDDLYIIHQNNNVKPQVIQATDYYPYGLSFNTYQADRLRLVATSPEIKYEPMIRNRILFQDQELQPDLKLGWYQYKYRMHDPAIGRFGSVDPLAEDYTYNSPYAFSENKLIQGRELEGLESIAYETIKYFSFVSFKFNGSFTSHDSNVGVEVSLGIPKAFPFSYRKTFGISYKAYDWFQSDGVWETRSGTETSILGGMSFQSLTYKSGETSQTTGMLTLGFPALNAKYENDWWDESWMSVLDPFSFHPKFGGDSGDRFRTAAARVTAGPWNFGFNLATGDPGPAGDRAIDRELGGKKGTYIESQVKSQFYDPDRYRLGLAYFGLGPLRMGINNEKIRHGIQNRFAHDLLMYNDPSPWFLRLPAHDQLYFGLSTGSGSSW